MLSALNGSFQQHFIPGLMICSPNASEWVGVASINEVLTLKRFKSIYSTLAGALHEGFQCPLRRRYLFAPVASQQHVLRGYLRHEQAQSLNSCRPVLTSCAAQLEDGCRRHLSARESVT